VDDLGARSPADHRDPGLRAAGHPGDLSAGVPENPRLPHTRFGRTAGRIRPAEFVQLSQPMIRRAVMRIHSAR
jgi:hypothetical protein